MKKALFTLLLFCFGFFVSACGDGGGGNSTPNYFFYNVNVENTDNNKIITLSKNTFTINVGETDNITVTLEGEDITNKATFTSNDDSIATVENGIITAQKKGTAIFTVSYQDAEDVNFTVTVVDPNLPTLEVSTEEINIDLSTQTTNQKITVTLEGKDVTSQATFTSSDESIATVDDKGNITPLKEGNAIIVVHIDGANDKIVNINIYDPTLHKMELNFEEITLFVGNSEKIIVTVGGNNSKKATFTSSDESIATVDKYGKITAVNEGNSIITVTDPNAESEKTVKVIVNKYNLTLSENDFTLSFLEKLNTKEDINVKNDDEKDVTDKATYQSNDESIVTVDDKGNIIAGTTEGTATITVKVNGANTTTFTVTVNDDSTETALDNTSMNQLYELGTITYNSTTKLTLTALTATDIPTYYRYGNTTYKITSIGEKAFQGCGSLETVTLPENIKKLEKDSFRDCRILTTISLPNGITEIGNRSFRGCSLLENINMPENLTKIGNEAFRGCTSLTSLIIPNTVTDIGTSAFIYCKSLKNVTMSSGITVIKDETFEGCPLLESITNIPNGVTSINYRAFYQCDKLKSITIPATVTTIGDSAFRECNNLTSITFALNEESESALTTIDKYAFHRCISVKNIILPNGITDIKNNAFRHCDSLESITIPNSVTTIEDSVFSYCSSLKSITIPESVTTIGSTDSDNWEGVFHDCTSLTSVIIQGNNLTTIGHGVFSSCDSLTRITIPNSVTTIGNSAFSYCDSLTSITIP